MRRRLDADRFLEDLTGRYARRYADALQTLLVAIARGDRPDQRTARIELRDVVRETMGVSEILGSSVLLREAAELLVRDGIALRASRVGLTAFATESTQTILPRVTFDEAVQDLVERTPVTIRPAAARTAQAIAQLYAKGRVIAFARSAEQAVTERAARLIADAIREGIPEADAARRIVADIDVIRERTAAWTEGYARMAFRTNVNTAVTAGRFRQARDPDIRKVIPAFRFDAVGDADTRPNHEAADGTILAVDNPAWRHLAPPLGYNCRCQVTLMSRPVLERAGRISLTGDLRQDRVPTTAGPDPGFRHAGRPDLFLSTNG